ncbi:Importin subunit beta-1 [Nymphaea thermarum]|nr:Importin subunit beta-1 [Nymphaea thermarum]
MAVEVTEILLNAQSIDGTVRNLAEDTIRKFQENHLPTFLVSLSAELANDRKPTESRMLAGLVLKNALDAREPSKKTELAKRWISIDEGVRKQIKEFLLLTLFSHISDARSTSSQVISRIACIELPLSQWQDLVRVLLLNMGESQGESSDRVRQATLETLGYLCEEISANVLSQDQVNSILTAVVQGMNAAERSDDVRLYASQSLNNAIMFAESNFNNDTEREYILKVVCEATTSSNTKIRLAAFECLVSIASAYYSKLVSYMKDLFIITAKAIKEDDEPVALQAIEFWSTICDEEIDILEESEAYVNGVPNTPCFYFIKQALPVLVPMLLETLLKQEDGQDQDEGAWNISMAGGTCLGLIARAVGDEIVPFVVPFVEENITKPEWRRREAATYAFGSILEGPSPDKLSSFVDVALNFLLHAMKDESNHVKSTTAWTLGRIFEFMHDSHIKISIVNESKFPHILSVLIESLRDVPTVAEKSYVMHALLIAAQRSDAGESRLRVSACETLNEVVRCSSEETASIVIQLVPVLMSQLDGSLNMQDLPSEEREARYELQALLCGCLQVVIQKLTCFSSTKCGLLHCSDQLMSLFIRVLACRSSAVHEEAMLAIGALAYLVGENFIKHMQDLSSFLEMGLRNYDEHEVCAVTIGVTGDLCRALDDKILPFCDSIMTVLLQNLSCDQLHRSVKPLIFSCFGDIALAIGENFNRYLVCTMPMLRSAAEFIMQSRFEDDEGIEFANQLRSGILEAYSGIFQGFKSSSSKTQILMPYAGHILEFLESIYQEREMDDTVTKAAIGVLGDLADTLGVSAAPLLRQSVFYRDFVDECLSSDDYMIKETAEWAQLTVRRVVSG